MAVTAPHTPIQSSIVSKMDEVGTKPRCSQFAHVCVIVAIPVDVLPSNFKTLDLDGHIILVKKRDRLVNGICCFWTLQGPSLCQICQGEDRYLDKWALAHLKFQFAVIKGLGMMAG